MASQGARPDPVVGREESRESAEGLVAPASEGGVDIGREGVGVDAPIPPGGTPALFRPKPKHKHNFLHRRMHLFSASTSSCNN
ncbi:UNVERIFIED_CONTAM: hypothetical protein Sradi_0190300 [Sesamum radiatum]|uniref:Uncharacterized protein n=1 Tax=Sesamum radiatum TaxID=300843 RepID=A0AAW2VYU1_SESRA